MMDLTGIYRDKSPSFGSKATLVCIHLLAVIVALWLLLGGGIATLDDLIGCSHPLASDVRRGALAAAAAIYLLRTVATIFIFMRRRMPWSEVGLIGLWIAVLDFLFAYFGGRNDGPFGLMGVVGAALLLVGSAINTGSELQRHFWKRRPVNVGHLYTGGLFRRARHINYFGDEILFTGWVLMTGRTALLLIPVIMVLGFILINIPGQDRYLEQRYGDEYRTYARRVKRFVPYVY